MILQQEFSVHKLGFLFAFKLEITQKGQVAFY